MKSKSPRLSLGSAERLSLGDFHGEGSTLNSPKGRTLMILAFFLMSAVFGTLGHAPLEVWKKYQVKLMGSRRRVLLNFYLLAISLAGPLIGIAPNTALSAQEIKQLYNLGAEKFAVSPSQGSGQLSRGLVGYLTFDGKDMVK